MLHEKDIKVPPRAKWPEGVSLPPSTTRGSKAVPYKDTGSLENAIPNAKKQAAEKEADEVRSSEPFT